MKLAEIQDKLQANVAKGLTDIQFLLPKAAQDVKDEAKAQAALEEKLSKMSDYQRRKYEIEQKRKARMEADLEPERLMRAGMESEKRMLQTCKAPQDPAETSVMFERLRGIVINEEDDTQDFEMVVSADDVTFRGMRN